MDLAKRDGNATTVRVSRRTSPQPSCFPSLPLSDVFLYDCGYQRACLSSFRATCQEPIVLRVSVSNVSQNSKLDCVCVEVFCRRRPANPAGVLLTSMFRNCALLFDGTAWKELANAPRERTHIFRILFLTSLGGAVLLQATGFSIRQAFTFCSSESFFFNQYTLPFVALPRSAKADHNSTQRRIAARSPSEGGIATPKENEVVEIGARQA
jgi:hypothetical protein